jgi:hypothetical protein
VKSSNPLTNAELSLPTGTCLLSQSLIFTKEFKSFVGLDWKGSGFPSSIKKGNWWK